VNPSFASYLRAELARRCAGNERYSLRAFARDLEIEHATLRSSCGASASSRRRRSSGWRRASSCPSGSARRPWPAPPEVKAFVQLFLEVPDVAAALDRAVALGARVAVPRQTLPDGDEMAVLVDPEGLPFGIHRLAGH
jgi:hypothetical protein